MIQPTVSCIVPCYNVEQWVEEAVESILQQADAFHEVILVDDGSTDRTYEVISRFADHPLVRIERTKNAGLGAARNRGLEIATGEYVVFVDSDDMVAPGLAALIQELKPGGFYSRFDLVLFGGECFVDGAFTSNFLPDYQRRSLGNFERGSDAIRALHDANCSFPNAYLYISKRRLWSPGDVWFKAIVHEDEEVFMRLVMAASNISVTDCIGYRRRIRSNSIMTGGPKLAHLKGIEQVIRTLMSYGIGVGEPYSEVANVVRSRLFEHVLRYLTLASQLATKPNYGLVVHTVLRVRSLELAFRAARLLAFSEKK